MAKKKNKPSKKEECSETKTEQKKEPVKSVFAEERVITENSDGARELYNQSRYGTILDNGKVQLSLLEALYLLEKERLIILDGTSKKINIEKFIKKAKKMEPNFWIRYCVFKDMRNRGYIIKTALKFGADFRIYEKKKREHAKWICFTTSENQKMTWQDFSAKNRIAHSTKKNLLIAIADEEGDVSYYEVKWTKP